MNVFERITDIFTKFFKYWPLLKELIKRDIRAKYKRSMLGVLWTVLHPLLDMLVMSFVFSTLFQRNIDNFPVYLICGRTIFHFFSEATNSCMTSIQSNSTFIKRIYLPKYMIPLSRVLSATVNMFFSLIAILLVMLITGAQVYWTFSMVLFPILYTFLFSYGIGLILAAGMVFFEDLKHLYGVFLTMFMYCTPIFYPVTIYPEKYAFIFKASPLYHLVSMCRNVIYYGVVPTTGDHLICLAYGIGAMIIGIAVFVRNQNKFILYV